MVCVNCVKSVRIRHFSGPYFPAFRLNTERCGVPLRIQAKYGKIRTRKPPNMDTFHAVYDIRGVANKWLETYLRLRKYDASFNGFTSNTSTLTFGVPQNSVLGLLVFLIYVNGLNSSLKFCQVYRFANDTNLLHINDSSKLLN